MKGMPRAFAIGKTKRGKGPKGKKQARKLQAQLAEQKLWVPREGGR